MTVVHIAARVEDSCRADIAANRPSLPEWPIAPNMRNLTGQVRKTEAYYFANGGFADMWRAEWRDEQNGQIRKVAVKILRSAWNDSEYVARLQRRLEREAMVWSILSHPNITPFYGACFDLGRPSIPCLVTPYLANGHVIDYLSVHPEKDRLDLVTQVAAGLTYLHNLSPVVIHGDIKGSNILINDEGNACLCDFGLSRILQSSGFTTKTVGGTCRWMAVELLAPDDDESFDDEYAIPITPATDTWAFAMTVLEFFTGKPPFLEFKHDAAVIINVIGGARPQRSFSGITSDRLWSVLERCWETTPSARPSIRNVGLALDLIHRTGEDEFDHDAVTSLLTEHLSTPHQPRRNKTLDCRQYDYPCKWDGCPSKYETLRECKGHEYYGHCQARWDLTHKKVGLNHQDS